MVILCSSITGCNYYRVVQQDVTSNAEKVGVLEKNPDRKVLLHLGDQAFLLNNACLDTTRLQLTGTLAAVPKQHQQYVSWKSGNMLYHPNKDAVLEEIHVYASSSMQVGVDDVLNMDLKSIQRIELLERDDQKSRQSTFWTIFGLSWTVVAIVVAVLFPSINID